MSNESHSGQSPHTIECLAACVEWSLTGSNWTCDPPVTDTDIDYICLVDNTNDFMETAIGAAPGGYAQGSFRHTDPRLLRSIRFENINFIVTDTSEFYRRFVAATSVAKLLNLQAKADRIALFQAVLYGNAVEVVA